eukprot:gene17715-biopygen11956
MDAGLVAGARAAVQRGVVAAVLAWLIVERVEAASRFGLYRATCFGDDAFCAEVKTEFGGDNEVIPNCNCAAPPCAQPAAGAIMGWISMALVFVVDYVLTRGFATRMRDREAALEASIDAAEDVGIALAAYDTDAARALVDGGEGEALPPRLRRALRELVDNLQSYRPFLPQSVLKRGGGLADGGGVGQNSTAAVPPPRGKVAVAFSDIIGSTCLWEA